MKWKKITAVVVCAGVIIIIGTITVKYPPRAEAAGSIISSFQINGPPGEDTYQVFGVTKINDHFWVSDGWYYLDGSGAAHNHVYEVAAASGVGSIVNSFREPSGFSVLKGIAYRGNVTPYGECLWLCVGENPPSILTMTTAGSVVSSFNTTAGYRGAGLAWDGSCLYNVDYKNRRIYKYASTGSVVGSFGTPDADPSSGRIPFGAAHDGAYLWLTSYGKNDQIYKLNASNGSVYSSFAPPNEHPFPTAIMADEGYLWYVDDSTDTFYKIDK